jgi:hypothetical protein
MSTEASNYSAPDSSLSPPLLRSESAVAAGSGASVPVGGASGNASATGERTPFDAPSLKQSWLRLVGASVLGLLVVSGGVSFGIYQQWRDSGLIASSVVVQGQDLGGLTREQARQKLLKRFAQSTLKIQTSDSSYHVFLRQLGGTPQIDRAVGDAFWYGRKEILPVSMWRVLASREETNVRLPVAWNKTQMRRGMAVVAQKYAQPGRDATLQVTDGVVQVIGESTGRAMNVGATLKNLQARYYLGMPSLHAVVRTTQPRITSADLSGEDVELGRYPHALRSLVYEDGRAIFVWQPAPWKAAC